VWNIRSQILASAMRFAQKPASINELEQESALKTGLIRDAAYTPCVAEYGDVVEERIL
jgi:hypothetical protein